MRAPTHHKQKRRHKWKLAKPDRCFLSESVGKACDEFLRKRGLKSVLLAIGFLWAVDANAQRVYSMETQFGGPSGYTLAGSGFYVNSSTGNVQHLFGVPGPIISMVGTITVKRPNCEVLILVMANGTLIWHGEVCNNSTLPVNVQFPLTWNLGGNIWIDWQSINATGYDLGDGGCWEYQLSFYGL